MKHLLYLFPIIALFACSEKIEEKPTQDYTSYTLTWIGGNSELFSNYKTAYFDEEGKCILLFEHEQLQEGIETKEYIMPEFVSPIYLFYTAGKYCMRLEVPFTVRENKKNRIIVPDSNNTRGIDITEPSIYNWPH